MVCIYSYKTIKVLCYIADNQSYNFLFFLEIKKNLTISSEVVPNVFKKLRPKNEIPAVVYLERSRKAEMTN